MMILKSLFLHLRWSSPYLPKSLNRTAHRFSMLQVYSFYFHFCSFFFEEQQWEIIMIMLFALRQRKMAATIPADNLFSHSSAGYKTFYTRPSKVSYEKERSQIPTLFENVKMSHLIISSLAFFKKSGKINPPQNVQRVSPFLRFLVF